MSSSRAKGLKKQIVCQDQPTGQVVGMCKQYLGMGVTEVTFNWQILFRIFKKNFYKNHYSRNKINICGDADKHVRKESFNFHRKSNKQRTA